MLQDFNGDGNLDIAAVDGAKAFVWLGNGQGKVTSTISITAPHRFDNFTAADFNNDGIPDLALVYSNVCGDACPGPNNNRVYVYKNNGKAEFTLASATDFGGCSAGFPVAADVNGDGNMDLNLVGPDPMCGFSVVAFGNGKGGFTSQSYGPSGGITSWLMYRDLNLDSRKDVAVSDALAGDIAVGLATSGNSNCAPPPASKLAGKLCYPLTTAPKIFTLKASGNAPSGVKRLEIWIDGVKKYQKLDDQLSHTFTLTSGQHRITVVAVDQYSGFAKMVKTITVN